MIELSTPLLPGLPSGMRPAGVSLGMTSDFALALAQISAPAEAAPTPDVAAPPGALSQAIAMPDRQIAAVTGNVLPVGVAFKVDATPAVEPDPTMRMVAESLAPLSSVSIDTQAECGAEIIAQTKRPLQTELTPVPDVDPPLPEHVLAEGVPTDGEARTSQTPNSVSDPLAAEGDVAAARPVSFHNMKRLKAAEAAPVIVPVIADEASMAAAESASSLTEPKRDEAHSSPPSELEASALGMAVSTPIDPVTAPSISIIGSNAGETSTTASVSLEASHGPKRARTKEAVGVASPETPIDQARQPAVMQPSAVAASATSRAKVDRIVGRSATVAVPLSPATLTTVEPPPIPADSAPSSVSPFTAGRVSDTVFEPTLASEAPPTKQPTLAETSPPKGVASAPQPAAAAAIRPSVAGESVLGSAGSAIVTPAPRSSGEVAPVRSASINSIEVASPAAADFGTGEPAPMPTIPAAPQPEPALAHAAALTGETPPTPRAAPADVVSIDAPVASQAEDAIAAPAPAITKAFRAIRAISRAAVDAPASSEAAVRMPSAPPTPAVQPAAQAFATAMFAAESAPRPTARTRSTDVTEPLPIDALIGANPAAPHVTVQPIADPKAPPLDLTRQDWLASMIDRIETIRDESGGRETRIRLAPDALGTIDLSLRHDERGELKVHIAAENPQARAILAEAAPRLTDMAEARGLKLGGSFVDAGTTGGDPRRDPQRAETQQTQRPASARGREADTTDTNDSRIA